MNRRLFLKGLLAASVAPAIVKAENIMRVRPLPDSGVLVPTKRVLTLDNDLKSISIDYPNGDMAQYYCTIDAEGMTVQELYRYVQAHMRNTVQLPVGVLGG